MRGDHGSHSHEGVVVSIPGGTSYSLEDSLHERKF
jgi:hypothetical protein